MRIPKRELKVVGRLPRAPIVVGGIPKRELKDVVVEDVGLYGVGGQESRKGS